MKTLCFALMVCASVAQAETPLSGAEFDAYTRGKTLTYFENGAAYGIEQYLDGNRVRWAFDGDQCQDGSWAEFAPGLICFSYDNAPDVQQCWNFFRTDNGLRAVFADGETPTELYEARQSNAPMLCLGPDVGA